MTVLSQKYLEFTTFSNQTPSRLSCYIDKHGYKFSCYRNPLTARGVKILALQTLPGTTLAKESIKFCRKRKQVINLFDNLIPSLSLVKDM